MSWSFISYCNEFEFSLSWNLTESYISFSIIQNHTFQNFTFEFRHTKSKPWKSKKQSTKTIILLFFLHFFYKKSNFSLETGKLHFLKQTSKVANKNMIDNITLVNSIICTSFNFQVHWTLWMIFEEKILMQNKSRYL